MSSSFRILTFFVGALMALGLVACGGGDSGSSGVTSVSADSSPQDVLDAALGGGGDSIESGVLDLKFDLESSTGDAGAISAEISGPFSSNGTGELPDLDLDVTAGAEISGPTLSFDGGLTLTQDGLWINYVGDDYQLDDATFTQVKDSYAQSTQLQEEQQSDGDGSLSQFGVDPETWLTDVTNEGTEDLDGTETVHVSGTGDITKIVDDLSNVAQQSGQQQVDTAALQQLENSISNATVDVYAAASDGSLRRLDVTVDIANGGGNGTSTVTLSIGIGDPNSDQTVTPPESAMPLEDLLGQLPGVADSLGGIAPSSTGSTGSSGSSGAAGAGSSDVYYQCVAQAPTPQDVADCSKFLNGG